MIESTKHDFSKSNYLDIPHCCDDSKCHGNINRQKLDMFDGMVDVIQAMSVYVSKLEGQSSVTIDGILTRARALQEATK